MNERNKTYGATPRRSVLAVALAMGLGLTGVAYGQATTGSIFGQAPAASGETVKVVSESGATRTVSVDATTGRYNVSNLPVGTYTVTLMKSGEVVSTRQNVSVSVGAGVQVPFIAPSSANAQNIGAVSVVASALPAIDVTSVNSTTVITSKQLEQLPVGRDAESIALLAPGTVKGSSYFGNAISFGGSSVAENAYYVNGYNTGEPYRNIGGFQLPYGVISQQETLTGGFSAKYGRSDGGVISQIGKSGTNEWHFGAQVVWEPEFLQSTPDNYVFPTQELPTGTFTCTNDGTVLCPVAGTQVQFQHSPGYAPGSIGRYRKDNKSWRTIYSAYASGPLIKDKLFMFMAVETTKTNGTNVRSKGFSDVQYYTNHSTKYYGKLNWNINDDNILETTILQSNTTNNAGATYNFDYNTYKPTTFKGPNDKTKDNAKFLIAHYTSYISDNATLSVLWGKGSFANPFYSGYQGDLPYISRAFNQNPAYLPAGTPSGTGITNPNSAATVDSVHARQSTRGLRVDFNYVLGDHNLGVGIDNMTYAASNQGTYASGPGYWWQYSADGQTVYKRVYQTLTSMSMKQRAYYLQDNWQVTPNLALSLGLRNDRYTNYNDQGLAFVDEKNQWEPRLGFTWDVNGDSSFKVYGNAGRYYLALPNNAAERAANISILTYEAYTYTGIDPTTGVPTGLTKQWGPWSPDGEYGNPKDPLQVTATNLKPMYIDQFNVGFDKKLGDNWVYGAKASYRALKTTIDDECSPGQIAAKMDSMGLNSADYSDSLYGPAYCRLINPGKTSDLLVARNDGSGYVKVPMSMADWGFLKKPKRQIAALNLYLEHPFDGTWYGRIDYTFTHARGNTAGQVRPDFGQQDVSKTEDWDAWQLMQGADGELLNSRKHVVRIRGAYAVTPEWLLSTTALIQSGMPEECLGYYGPSADGDPTGYNGGGDGSYHWCAGKIVSPGFRHTPWTKQINIGVRYTPLFADKKLAFKLDVFNVLNEQKVTQTMPGFVNGAYYVSNYYHYPVSLEPPRYVRLSVSYDY